MARPAPARAPPGRPPTRERKSPRSPPAQQGCGSAGVLPWAGAVWGAVGPSTHRGPAARPGAGRTAGLVFRQAGLWGVTAAA